ncbi:MAG: hypothetical protein HUU34_13700 [Saprospiraceae bacterium]|nr:hypothetical protein [Saprospiraceae bacterium]
MARTEKLSSDDLELLREKIRKKFQYRMPGKEIPGSTYKEAYEDLREDILKQAPDGKGSVSLNRLRKLFYYTDPKFCSEDKLENAVFGKDFLSVLELYISDENGTQQRPVQYEPSFKGTKRWIWLGSLGLLIITFLSMVALLNSKVTKKEIGWKEDFTSLSKDSLKARGWEIWDSVPNEWPNQLKPGYLTLYTIPGDYWVKPGESRTIGNFLVKRIDCDCCIVTMKINGFFPSQNHQQVGFFILDEKNPRKNNLKYTYRYAKIKKRDLHHEDILFEIEEIGLETFNQKEGEIIDYDQMTLCDLQKITPRPCLDTVQLQIRFANGSAEFYWQEGNDWQGFRATTMHALAYNFKPHYLGITAIQGLTKEDYTPLGAKNIPAFIDFVKVEPCSSN